MTWYDRYDELYFRVQERKQQLKARCEELGRAPDLVLQQVHDDLIARAVQESNWQEGIRLNEAKTHELTLVAFEHCKSSSTLRLDLAALLEEHTQHVVNLKKSNAIYEEIAAYNLAKAHITLRQMLIEIMHRVLAIILRDKLITEGLMKLDVDKIPELQGVENDLQAWIQDKIQSETQTTMTIPMIEGILSKQEYFYRLVNSNNNNTKHIFTIDYIHFLHRIIFTGINPPSELGVFRQNHVHVLRYELRLATANRRHKVQVLANLPKQCGYHL